MSFVTRCTSCGTLFKVVADQLKISEGWVRCGQCATVFDAQANLISMEMNTSAVEPPNQSSTDAYLQASDAKTKSDDPIMASAELSHDVSKDSAFSNTPDDLDSDIQSFRASKLRDSTLLPLSITPSSTQAAALDSERSLPISVLPGSEEPTTFIPASRLDSALPQEPLSEQSDAAPLNTTLATPEFVKQAQRAQRWRSPAMRLGLSFIALVLLAALILQISLQDKDRIAAQWPQAKPWLDQLCVHAGCKVQAVKRIEAIAVDASSFNRINKSNASPEVPTQSYRLAVTLKNIGTLPVALPHVELSLQDAQDQPILRRILSPSDLGSGLLALAPAQDMAGNLTLQIDTAQLGGNRIAGYRVLAFYP